MPGIDLEPPQQVGIGDRQHVVMGVQHIEERVIYHRYTLRIAFGAGIAHQQETNRAHPTVGPFMRDPLLAISAEPDDVTSPLKDIFRPCRKSWRRSTDCVARKANDRSTNVQMLDGATSGSFSGQAASRIRCPGSR